VGGGGAGTREQQDSEAGGSHRAPHPEEAAGGTSFGLFKGVQRMLPKYFSSEWSFAQFRVPPMLSIVAFGNEADTIMGAFVLCRPLPARLLSPYLTLPPPLFSLPNLLSTLSFQWFARTAPSSGPTLPRGAMRCAPRTRSSRKTPEERKCNALNFKNKGVVC